jgi:toxin ParE1/3/4
MPTSFPRVRFTPAGRRDVGSILQSTARLRGIPQRDAYATLMDEAFGRLDRFPLPGRPRDDDRSDLRSYAVEQHVILYRLEGDVVVVLRVVHARQDLTRLSIP